MTITYLPGKLIKLHTRALKNILLVTGKSTTILGRIDTYSDKRHCRRILILNQQCLYWKLNFWTTFDALIQMNQQLHDLTKRKKKIEINLKVNFTTLDSTHHPQTTRQAYYKQTRPEFPDYLTSKKIAAIIYCIILILLLTCLKSLVRQSFKKSQTTSQYINRSVRKKMVTEDDQFFLYSWLVSSKLSLAWKSALLLYLAAVE